MIPEHAGAGQPSVPPTWLVTGGAGFIGSALVRQLITETSNHVVNVDALTYAGHLESLGDSRDHPRHTFVHLDITDAAALRAVLAAYRPSTIVHLAAETHVDRSIDDPGAFVRTNVVGTFTLLEAVRDYWRTLPSAAANAFRLLHVSTDEVFGSADPNVVFDEGTPYNPSSPYAASKAASDHLARAWHRTYGVPVIVTSCSNNYGPYQFPEKLIPLVIRKAISHLPIPVYGDGLHERDWLHVDDHARALRAVAAAGVPGRTYAVGARGERSNLAVVRQICRELDALRPCRGARHESRITLVDDRPGHDRRYAIDPTRIEQEIGWRPQYDFEVGLRETVHWYLEHEAWVQTVIGDGYRGERLGVTGP